MFYYEDCRPFYPMLEDFCHESSIFLLLINILTHRLKLDKLPVVLPASPFLMNINDSNDKAFLLLLDFQYHTPSYESSYLPILYTHFDLLRAVHFFQNFFIDLHNICFKFLRYLFFHTCLEN